MSFPPYTPAEAQSRETFLALMWALSYPGRVHVLPEGLDTFSLIAETLLDLETSYFTRDDSLAAMLVRTGAHARDVIEAAYHFYTHLTEDNFPYLRQASVGTMLYPDTGVTLVVGCTLGEGTEFVLNGPGVNGQQIIQVAGVPDAFWTLRDSVCRYPLGWDVFLVDDRKVIGLPRSTRLERV